MISPSNLPVAAFFASEPKNAICCCCLDVVQRAHVDILRINLAKISIENIEYLSVAIRLSDQSDTANSELTLLVTQTIGAF